MARLLSKPGHALTTQQKVWLVFDLMTERALLVDIVGVAGRRRLDIPRRIVAKQAFLPPFQSMLDLRRQPHDRGGRLDPSLRRVA